MSHDDVTRTNPSRGSPAAVDAAAAARAERFAPGAMLGTRYRIAGRIGAGGMGDLYRADDLTLGVPVALKFLPPQVAGDPARLARFRGEVRVARQISHAHICRVFDIGEADGLHFIAMEYVDGEDLASLLRRIGRLPHDKAVEMSRQLCAGLAAAHGANILHRDLKPANILIDGRGQLRIADFGLAGLADSFVARDVRSGTPAYMAPEQLDGREVTSRSDIYALGLVMYEMFTGRRAIGGDTLDAVAAAHRSLTPTNPSSLVQELDPAVSRVILRCLEKEPARRPESALKVALALPGGDPLQAALAAGETPSPELVAAAGRGQGLSPRTAVALLGTLLAGLLGYLFVAAPLHLLNAVGGGKSPVVLTERAREMVRSFGYATEDVDSASGLHFSKSEVEERHARAPRAAPLELGRSGAVRFWYRQAHENLTPAQPPMQITINNPPVGLPGHLQLETDLEGRLLWFAYTPRRVADFGQEPGETTPAGLFALAGLDLEQFQPAEPDALPPAHCDRWEAWRGSDPADGRSLRVEAALLGGRPVYFSVAPADGAVATAADETEPGGVATTAEGAEVESQLVAGGGGNEFLGHMLRYMLVAMLLGVVSLGCLLAWRNVQLGRGDRRGAFKMALLVLVALLAAWALVGAHGRGALAVIFMFYRMSAVATLIAMLTWVGYVAIEPYVRKIWPSVLIGWTRLLAGGWRDALVGRDVLVGMCAGVVWTWLFLVPWGVTWLAGAEPPAPLVGAPPAQLMVAMGPRYWVGVLASALLNPVVLTVVILLVLVALRALTGRKSWAVALLLAFFFMVSLIGAAAQPGGLALAENAGAAIRDVLALSLLTVILLRLGLLATAVANLTVGMLVTFPLTTDPGAWYFSATPFVLGLIVTVAGLAFQTARAGRPLIAGDWLDPA